MLRWSWDLKPSLAQLAQHSSDPLDGEDPSRGCYTQCGNGHCLEGSLRTPTIDYSWEA